MKLINNIAYLSFNEVVSYCQLSSSYLKRALRAHRNNEIKCWPHIKEGRKVWIKYDGLRKKYQKVILANIGNPYTIVQQQDLNRHNQQIQTALATLPDAMEQYYQGEDYIYFIRQGIDQETATHYATIAAWLRLCNSKWYKKAGFTSKDHFLQAVINQLAEHPLNGLKCSNIRHLKRRITQFRRHGLESVISRKIGNQNSAKLTGKPAKFVLERYASPLKPSIPEVRLQYLQEAKKQNWEPVSEQTIHNYLYRPNIKQKWYAARHGQDAARNAFERTIKRRRASYPDALWVLDGTTVPLIYQDEQGKRVYGDLYILAVLDASSDNIIGYALSWKESAMLVQSALRDACRKTMMHPFQVQYDNSSANLSQEVKQLMPRLSRVNFPVSPYNGKSKRIEQVFGRFQQRNLRHFNNFKGGNITSPSINSKANPDHIHNQKGQLPTINQAIAQVKLAIEVHNHTKVDGINPNERYNQQDERRVGIDYLAMVEMFWVERRQPVRYTKDGLRIQVDNTDYWFEVEQKRGIEDRAFRDQWLDGRLTIMYDPDDLSHIQLYYNGRWIATANQKYEAPEAVADYEDGEGQIINEALNERKRYTQDMKQEIEDVREEMRQDGIAELGYTHIHKDALNRIENTKLLNDLGLTNDKKPQKHTPYSGDDADGSVVNY